MTDTPTTPPVVVPPDVLRAAEEEAWRIAVCYGELVPDEAARHLSVSGLSAHMALNKAQISTVVYRIAAAIYAAGRMSVATDIRAAIPGHATTSAHTEAYEHAAQLAEGPSA